MKSIVLSLALFSSLSVFADSTREEQLKMCFETCLAYEVPGAALRKCISKCQEEYLKAEKMDKWCETYEDDCERGDTGI